MFYCQTCKNTYDISKITTVQHGKGKVIIDYDFIVNNIDTPEIKTIIASDPFNMEDLQKSAEYRKLKKNQKELINNKIQDFLPDSKKTLLKTNNVGDVAVAYFICGGCSYIEQIPPGTKIYSETTEISTNNDSYRNMINSDILPYTRKYTCPNKKCDSHSNVEKREAKFFRINNSYKLKMICMACQEIF